MKGKIPRPYQKIYRDDFERAFAFPDLKRADDRLYPFDQPVQHISKLFFDAFSGFGYEHLGYNDRPQRVVFLYLSSVKWDGTNSTMEDALYAAQQRTYICPS